MIERTRQARAALGCLIGVIITVSTGAGVARAGEEAVPSEAEIGVVQVLQNEADALREIFPDADSMACDTMFVDDSLRARLETLLGRGVRDSTFVCFDVFRAAARLGTAIVADESGKYRPITFMAGVDTALHVVDARVLVYRESRGGEIQKTRFLKQYRGKNLEDPIRINRDIINITGATISVNALNHGVRKALAVAALRRESVERTGSRP